MIGQGNHIEQVGADTAQVHALASNDHLSLNEQVLAVEFLNELPVGCSSHGDEIGDPGVHGVP